MKKAPKTPTTEQLKEMHTLSRDAEMAVRLQRTRIAHHIRFGGFVAAGGGCSTLEIDEAIVMKEAANLKSLQEISTNLSTHQRTCVWKPRSDPSAPFHGEEVENPKGAHRLVTELANRHANTSMEIAFDYHLERYGDRLVFSWIGSRNAEDFMLALRLAKADPKLTIGVKNGLDGNIETAIDTVDTINRIRADLVHDPAPAVLIYRGGENATTPLEWESMRQKAYHLTGGKMIDDSAHGTSIAHDPDNRKSDYGQQAALEHIMNLSYFGYTSSGLLIEASDAKSVTDPNLPFKIGYAAIREIVGHIEGAR
ncbi:MAG: hypothetical protein ACXWLH_05315 [Candidatus Saccharimonadales bacterium]